MKYELVKESEFRLKLNAKAQAKLLANPFSYVNVGLAKSLVVRLLHL